MDKELNVKVANEIKDFLVNHKASGVRIYFNGIAYSIKEDGEVIIIKDVVSTDFVKFGNNESITMIFDYGRFYNAVNYIGEIDFLQEFNSVLDKHNLYYELGYTWSLSIYNK